MRTKHDLIMAEAYDEIAHYLIDHDERPWYVPEKTKKYLIELSGGVCAICKRVCNTVHVDHKTPVSRGGKCFLSNLQVLCETCNLQKSNHCIDPASYERGYVIPINTPSDRMISGWVWDKLYCEDC